MKKISIFLVFLFILVCLNSCDKKTKVLAPQNQLTQIDLSITGLDNLGSDADYALWSEYGPSTAQETDFIGRFTVDNQGAPSQSLFNVPLGVIQKTVNLVISIENADSTLDSASVYQVIASKLKANSGTFSIGTEYLLNFDASQALGQYQVLTAPGTDSIQGIWFMTGFTDTTRAAGLELPDALPRWRYEAYVIVNGDSFPTGYFTKASAADAQNIYGSTDPAKLIPTFAFPGENIQVDTSGAALNIDLRGAEVVVNILPPVPPFSMQPFKLTMFKGTIPTNAQPDNIYQLNNTSDTFPGGKAEVIIKLFE